jgi:hypothetical protein
MLFDELELELATIGLEPTYAVYADSRRGERPTAGPAYTIVRETDGFAVFADSGREEPFARPYDGYRFPTESEAVEYVWRMARRAVAPHLLSPAEEEANRRDAEAAVKYRATHP